MQIDLNFHQVTDSIPALVAIYNIHSGQYLYVNKQVKKLLGYAPSEFIKGGLTFASSLIHPGDLARISQENKKAVQLANSKKLFSATEPAVNFEYRMRHQNGQWIWLHTDGSVYSRNKKGEVECIINVSIEITRRVEKLKATENNLRFLAEASKILSSSIDYKATLTNIAKAAVPKIADWCGVDILDDRGHLEQVAVAHKDPKKVKWAKELRKINPPDMNSLTGVPKVIRTGKSEYYPEITDEMLIKIAKNKKELKLLRNLGFTSAIVAPLCREQKCIGGISFVTTETKKHFTPADLEMAEELANRASVALENAGLYKASQRAITLRDDFISVASHELKTPVTSVKMFTQVLKRHSEQIGDTRAVDHLSKMDKQLNKLTELIYDLLNVSKIEAGKLEFKQHLFDFDKTVKEVVDILQQISPNHAIEIQGSTGKKVRGDAERISQVMNNLISNAIKYSPDAKKIIVHLNSEKNNVHVSVQDFGIGMAKEHLGHIFERFYRVYDTTDKTFPGLGIGLYISSEIVKRHGGKFWVESDIGKGSTFHFSLPINGKKSLHN